MMTVHVYGVCYNFRKVTGYVSLKIYNSEILCMCVRVCVHLYMEKFFPYMVHRDMKNVAYTPELC